MRAVWLVRLDEGTHRKSTLATSIDLFYWIPLAAILAKASLPVWPVPGRRMTSTAPVKRSHRLFSELVYKARNIGLARKRPTRPSTDHPIWMPQDLDKMRVLGIVLRKGVLRREALAYAGDLADFLFRIVLNFQLNS